LDKNINHIFRKIRNGFWEKGESNVIRGELADSLLDRFVQEFEDYKLDFKIQLPPDHKKTGKLISAISNEGGGVIFYGITDDRIIKGLDDFDTTYESIVRIARDKCSPIPELKSLRIITTNKIEILAILIPQPSKELVSYDDEYFKRISDSTEKMRKNEALTRQIQLLSIQNHYSIIWENSKNILPEDIIGPIRGLQSYGYNEYYLKRGIDEVFTNDLKDFDKNLLIIGSPLSGKSRLVFQSLINSQISYDIIIPKYCEFNLQDIIIPANYKTNRKKILILDDINRYFSFENFEHLFIKFLKEQDIKIIATCQSGEKYHKIKNLILEKLNLDIDVVFETIEMDTINEEEAKHIVRELNLKWENIDFDGNIGSIFLPLGEMKLRYNKIRSTKAKLILQSIKIAYLAGMVREKLSFDTKWISDICKIWFELNLEKYELILLIEELGPDGLQFIQYFEKDRIFIEETYLAKIIDPKIEYLALEDYEKLIEYYYSDVEELVLLGNNLLDFGSYWSAEPYYEVHPDVFNLSIKCFERLLEISPGSTYAYGVLGHAYRHIDNFDKSIYYYETALDFNPEIHNFWGNLGFVYRIVKNYDQAIYCFNKVLELNPDDDISYYQLALT